MHIFFLILTQILYYSHSIHAAKFEIHNRVPNTSGGSRFEKEIGTRHTPAMMKVINMYIWNKFQQYNHSDKINPQIVKLFIVSDLKKNRTSDALGKSIYIQSSYLEDYHGSNFPLFFISFLHHAMTHVFQWYGGSPPTAPQMLIEGIADYMTLVSWYSRVRQKPGEGERWDEGYGVTARFLEYCEGLQPGFVAQLNKMMRTHYSEDFFLKLMKKPVDQLWKDYKIKNGYNI